MASELPLTLQTAYADLLDRCAAAAFGHAFAEAGVFTPKTIRGRRYWYFQVTRDDGTRQQRYAGPESPELLERIRTHKELRGDQRDRRAIVSALVRSANLPRPEARIGDIVAALAEAGVFRLRGVVVGTVAYQTYAAMLGIRLPAAMVQTGDVDIAQFSDISIAVEETAPPILEALRTVDASFRPVPHLHDRRSVTSYIAKGGLRVDFLTPSRGRDTDTPAPLPALGTDAEQLRFLDFLIHDPVPAVLLHGEGVHVLVPSPERFALHKLIVARRRQEGAAKTGKDLKQAEALLDVLVRRRAHELKATWQEASGRGRRWRLLLGEGLGLIDSDVRDRTLKAVGAPRSVVPNLDLVFGASRAHYDFDRNVVTFSGEASGRLVRCAISLEALDDHFGVDEMNQDVTLKVFRDNRSTIERMARAKYLNGPVEEAGSVLIRTDDIERLRREVSGSS